MFSSLAANSAASAARHWLACSAVGETMTRFSPAARACEACCFCSGVNCTVTPPLQRLPAGAADGFVLRVANHFFEFFRSDIVFSTMLDDLGRPKEKVVRHGILQHLNSMAS